MAGTATNHAVTTPAGSDQRKTTVAINKLIDDLETLRAAFAAVLTKLDADAGVTDINYSSLHTVAAAALTAAKVQDRAGTAITT